MNDFLKFRAWSKPENCYIEDEYGCNLQPDGIVEFRYFSGVDQNETIVERCTGLKDTTGKLIYEGDITENNITNIRGRIIWCAGLAGFKKQIVDDFLDLWDGMEKVVGNIHDEVEK